MPGPAWSVRTLSDADWLAAQAAAGRPRGSDEPGPLDTGLDLAHAAWRFMRMSAVERWAVFDAALSAPRPSLALQALRRHGALAVRLPELDALCGVPQLCDGLDAQAALRRQAEAVNAAPRPQARLA